MELEPEAQVEQILNPVLPFTGEIPKGLSTGRMIVIDGVVHSNAKRFTVNFCCGTSEKADIAFHFNPRLDIGYVARNSRISGRWGAEEQTAPQRIPLRRGEPFYLHIFTSDSEYMVAVNGRHFCSFLHRLPFSRVITLQLGGDFQAFLVDFRTIDVYPTPETVSLPVPTLHHIVNPEVPFVGDLPEGVVDGREVEIHGRVKLLPYSFFINLQSGKQFYPHPSISLHLNPRFREGPNQTGIVIRNAWCLCGGWGMEERHSEGPFPFCANKDFSLLIVSRDKKFQIFVDGQLFTTFDQRVDQASVSAIYISGDVQIHDIYIR